MKIKLFPFESEFTEKVLLRWKALAQVPNADPDFFFAIVQANSERMAPFLMVITEGESEMMMAGRIEKTIYTLKLGYWKLMKIHLRSLVIIYGGIMGAQDERYCEAAIRQLINFARRRKLDILRFSLLSNDSSLYHILGRTFNKLQRNSFSRKIVHRKLIFENGKDNLQDYLKSKHRSWLKRCKNKLETEATEDVCFALYDREDHVELIMRHAEEIASQTYHRKIDVGFKPNDEMRVRLMTQADKGELYACFLYVGETPVCFWIGSLYKGFLHLSFTGYDPKFRHYEVGSITLVQFVEEIKKRGRRIDGVDFGFGDSIYKQKYANRHWYESDEIIYFARPKSVVTKILFDSTDLANRALLGILRKIEIENKVKRFFRRINRGTSNESY